MTEETQSWNDRIIEDFRKNGGNVGTANFGRTLVLVHHKGAKTGQERITPLRGLPIDNGRWLVVGSAQGADFHPDWYHNLMAHPDVTLETPDEGDVKARATVLTGAERAHAWSRFTESYPMFLQY